MAKSKLVTLKLSPDLLKKYPLEASSKKKITLTLKPENDQLLTPKRAIAPKLSNNKKESPTPETPGSGTPQPVVKTGFGRNAVSEDRKLDKTGRSVRKWVKQPLKIQTFTGYAISFKSWSGEQLETDSANDKTSSKIETKTAATSSTSAVTPNSSKPALKIQLKLNNKTLALPSKKKLEDDSVPASRDLSPSLDEVSSIVSTPEVSAVSTPAP